MNSVIHLLWTGGWDSTYRLLDLVLVKGRVVQSYYVIDRARRSYSFEINAMEEIRRAILDRNPKASGYLLPVQFTQLNDIPSNNQITQQYHRLLEIGHLGGQYEWLPRFADSANLHTLELCIQKGDFAFKFLELDVIKEGKADFEYYQLNMNVSDPDLELFKDFRFPIFHLSKLEMRSLVMKHGFENIMSRTWFCHSPLKNGMPCGNCTPCNEAVRDGFASRLPRSSLIRWVLLYKPRTGLKGLKRLLLAGEPHSMRTVTRYKNG
jgi:hypothetical protein